MISKMKHVQASATHVISISVAGHKICKAPPPPDFNISITM